MIEIDTLIKGSAAYYIDDEGRDHSITMDELYKYIAEDKYTVKVEGLEGLVEIPDTIKPPYTVHAYLAPKGAASFDTHADPYPVWIYCIEGQKDMEIRGTHMKIMRGMYTMIPAYTLHRALNYERSVMLSIGQENDT